MDEKFNKTTDVKELGEFGLIDRLTKDFSLKQKSSIKGVGDDSAVIMHAKECILVSTDLLIEGIHFDLMYMPLKHLGYKAVVVNLSDIYAMNGQAEQITVSIGLSSKFSVEALEEFYAGILKACDFYNVDLVGGDTSSAPKGLTISITAIGTANIDKITYRSGAQAGDIICVSGDLGAAYLGLQLLEREKQIYLSNPEIQPNLEEQDYLIGRQLKPEARRDMIAQFLKANLIPTAMIDVSDGLASDLFHICKQSKVGAYIEEGKIPMHPNVEIQALRFKLDPITCALNGGEDYELLFTVREKDLEKVRFMHDIYIIGEIVDAKNGIKLHTSGGNIHNIKAQGWKHF